MTKTQPLLKTPVGESPNLPVNITATRTSGGIDAVPRPLLWALLAISLLTFLIQLWNYFTV
jgi:hypothetical protein